MKRSIAAFLIVITTASFAWAANKTDREIFQKSVAKVAPSDRLRSLEPESPLGSCQNCSFSDLGTRLFRLP